MSSNDKNEDNVPPRDIAESRAREYEEGQYHERAGNKGKIDIPSHKIKPKSVRMA